MVVGVSDDNDVLLGDEVDTQWVLQLCFDANAVCVAVCVQVAWIVVSTDQIATSLKRLHVDGANSRRLRVGDIQLDMARRDQTDR